MVLTSSDAAVSFTGNAGPEQLPGEAKVGEVYMAIVYAEKVWAIPLKLELERKEVREVAVNSVIDALISILSR